ncbi:Plant self-incompatibility S1 [Macleaya cordata]|uniref:S-protein homolog n=1 Tax=Macleaya cordata TaxID=56857 RepID=A0A200Q4Z8_MACCD|nr:Plant self-incompatibility S1 [Macleaya cordata]
MSSTVALEPNLPNNDQWGESGQFPHLGTPWGHIEPCPIHVSVVNEIPEQTGLTIHCKSADDDLGEHKLGYNQDFHWSFRQNFWQSTLFWCSMWWTDSDGHLVQGSYDIYSISTDWDRCHNECKYPVRQDGIYAFFEKPDPKFNLVFP